jgi:hypothetical protein
MQHVCSFFRLRFFHLLTRLVFNLEVCWRSQQDVSVNAECVSCPTYQTCWRSWLYLRSFCCRAPIREGWGGVLVYHKWWVIELRCQCLSVVEIGVISGALLYIRDDFEEVRKSRILQVCTTTYDWKPICNKSFLGFRSPLVNKFFKFLWHMLII